MALPPSRWTLESAQRYHDVYKNKPGVQRFTNEFIKVLEPSSTVVDAGCGTGLVAKPIVEAGHHVVGLDSSSAMLELCRTNVKMTLKHVNMFTYDSEKVDGVVAVLSLFESTKAMHEQFIQRASSWLKPGGHLLFCAFALDDLMSYDHDLDEDKQGAQIKGFRFMGKEVSFHVFTRDKWTKLINDSGMELLTTEMVKFEFPEGFGGDPAPDFFVIAKKT